MKNENFNNSSHDFGWFYFTWCHVFSLEISILLLVVLAATAAEGKVVQSWVKYLKTFLHFSTISLHK